MKRREQSWVSLRQDPDTGIETIRAHFHGHAYDAHWHDSYLVGFTEQGLQQFNCRGIVHQSRPGNVFLVEPGELHDGDAPSEAGFTYSMLYLEPAWLLRELAALDETPWRDGEPGFSRTLMENDALRGAIAQAFGALSANEPRIVRQHALDVLLETLVSQLRWRSLLGPDPSLPSVAYRARDYLHAHVNEDIGLQCVAQAMGVSRFRLSRAFKLAFGLAPHAYLIQLRLAQARQRLSRGESPAAVACALGFADQSHMGRWFRRAYGLTPANYRRHCTKLPDAGR